jgi:hypothetical protein
MNTHPLTKALLNLTSRCEWIERRDGFSHFISRTLNFSSSAELVQELMVRSETWYRGEGRANWVIDIDR